MNSKVGRRTNRCEIVINISNLTVVIKDSIGGRRTLSANLPSVEEETLESLLILQQYNFPTSYPKQAALDNRDNIYFGLPCLSQESMVFS